MMTTVGIIYGGNTIESGCSYRSASILYDTLSELPYNIKMIDIGDKNWMVTLSEQKLDLLIDLVYGCPGQEGTIKGLADINQVKYLGSDIFTHSLIKDKYISKLVAIDQNIATPRFLNVTSKDYYKMPQKYHEMIADQIGYPCIVKPRRKGGLSLGISYCQNQHEISKCFENVFHYDDCALIEQYILGREVSVCVVLINDVLTVLPMIEVLIEDGAHICNYDTKMKGKRKLCIPANISVETRNEISKISTKLFSAFGARDFCYFDFIIGNDIYFIEAGATPGLTETSNLTLALKEYNMDVANFFFQLINKRVVTDECTVN